MTERQGLQDRCIVVTRPARQAASLLEALRAAGAVPLFFSVIEIDALADVSPLLALGDRLVDYDFAFFVSANAVEQTLAVVPRERWPASLQIVTVGPGSARALHAQGFADVMLPESRFDSEGVLALPAMQADAVRDKRVLVLRGDGGRELLAQTLVERGAHVDVQSAYRRRRADSDATDLLAGFDAGKLDAISFTSSEGARNFVELVERKRHGAAAHLFATLPCFVPHARIAAQLDSLGARHVITTEAGDTALMTSLQHHFR